MALFVRACHGGALLLLLTMLGLLWPCPLAAMEPASGDVPANRAAMPAAPVQIYRQFLPEDPVASHYTTTSDISLALVAIPDPRVPRHHRAYDIILVALMQGMLDEGYILDRYSFPWQTALAESPGGKDRVVRSIDDCQFGVMLFRRDAWRNAETPAGGSRAPAVRALYLVPETSTTGLARSTTLAAIAAITRQVPAMGPAPVPAACVKKLQDADAPTPITVTPPADSDAHYATHPACAAGPGQGPAVLLLGPTFSGSLDSYAQIDRQARANGLPGLCAVSSTATSPSNAGIATFPDINTGAAATHPVRFTTLAESDTAKLAQLWDLSRRLGARGGQIVILSEASVFGHQVCPSQVKKAARCDSDAESKAWCFCNSAIQFSFPANISDIRSDANARRAEKDSKSALRGMMPGGEYLSLDDAAGNGSELPDSQQSKLTAASNSIELDKTLRMIDALAPKMLLVVATDIRDRLFLFDLLRDGIPYAQLVDMEADVLAAHPKSVHASRGAVLVASERLVYFNGYQTDAPTSSYNQLRLQAAATDYQMLLRSAVKGIDRTAARPWRARMVANVDCDIGGSKVPILNVVGQRGPIAMTCITPAQYQSRVVAIPILVLASLLLFFSAGPAASSFFGGRRLPLPALPRLWRERAWSSATLRRFNDWCASAGPTINPATGRIVLGMGLLLAAAILAKGGTLALAIIPIPVFCLAIAYQAGVFQRSNLAPRDDVPLVRATGFVLGRHFLLVLAVALTFATVGWWFRQAGDAFGQIALYSLASTANDGMAIGVAVLLSVLAMIFADNAMSIARIASLRNLHVIETGLRLPNESKLHSDIRGLFACGLVPATPVMAAGLLGLVYCLISAVPLKATVFGQFASALSLAAVTALTFVALSLFANGVRFRDRAVRTAAALRDLVLAQREAARKAGATDLPASGKEAIGLWPPECALRVRFARTPASALAANAGDGALALFVPDQWSRLSRHLCGIHQPNLGTKTRVALYLVLASEVALVRWATFSSALCALSVAVFAYLFPVSGASAFVLLNLALLAALGLFAGYTAMSLERDEVMSNVLCNRSAKLELSSNLFNYTAFPFVALAIGLAIVQVPGVLDIGDGVFQTLLRRFSGGLWN